MIIKSLSLEAFGPFAEETTIVFPERGINLVMGPNDSGKTLIMRAISSILFGLPEDEVELYRNGTSPVGKLQIGLADRDIEVIRYFDAGTAVIWDLSGAEPQCLSAGDEDKGFRMELARLIGVQEDSLANSTTFVPHGQMKTRIGETLRHALALSKRTDYGRVLERLKARQAKLDAEGERLEKTLLERTTGRQQAEAALQSSMALEAQAQSLEADLEALNGEVETETRTLASLATLEAAQAEQRQLEQDVQDSEATEVKVHELRAEQAATEQQVEVEHAPLLPMEATFRDDMQSLEEGRARLVEVQREVEAVNAHRSELEDQVRKLTDELALQFGAFKDLPSDFPQRLARYPERAKELERVTTELKADDDRITGLRGQIDTHYARFKPFDDAYEDALRDLDVQERYWRQQLLDLEGDQQRCRETANQIHQVEYNLQHDFGGFASVAKDFRSRLRNWHRIWEELKNRRGPVTQAQDEIAAIEVALKRWQQAGDDGAAAYRKAVEDLQKIDADLQRLTDERDLLLELHQERKSLLRRIDSEFAHLKDKARPDYPEKLREHVRLRQEYQRQSTLVEESRKRLLAGQAVASQRFLRFSNDPSWGPKLEEHRRTVDKAQATMERLAREDREVEEVLEALERLEKLSGNEPYEALAEPELLRELAALKLRTHSRQKEHHDLAERYREFMGKAEDLGDRLAAYQQEREALQALASQVTEATEAVGKFERRVAAIDEAVDQDFAPFRDRQDDIKPLIATLQKARNKVQQVQTELEQAQTRLKEMQEERGKGTVVGALLGWTTTKTKDVQAQEGKVNALQTKFTDARQAEKKAADKLGPLAGRKAVEVDHEAYRKLQDERRSVLQEKIASTGRVGKLQEQLQVLETRLKPMGEQLGVQTDLQAAELLERWRTYRGERARLAPGGDDVRLLELSDKLGPFASRFMGDPEGFEALATQLIEGHHIWQGQRGEREALKVRLGNLPHQTETAMARQETQAAVTEEAERIGIQSGESLEQLEAEWREFDSLQRSMASDSAVIRDFEEHPEGQQTKLKSLTDRLEVLAVDLGILVAHPDVEALIGEIKTYLGLLPRLQDLEESIAGKPPLETVERSLSEVRQARRGLEILEVAPGRDPETGFTGWQKAVERLQSRRVSLSRVLELEIKDGSSTTVADRLQKRLDDMAVGLGDFLELSDVDAALKRYDEYLALTVRLEGLRKMLEVMPPESELQATHRQVTAEVDEARAKLGLLPGETITAVNDMYLTYAELVRTLREAEETRNRLLASLWIGDRSGRSSADVLVELEADAEALRVSLGGFDEAGKDARELVAQFRAATELRTRSTALQADLDGLSSPAALQEWIEETRAPLLVLEQRLAPAGDVNNLAALQARFDAFEALQNKVRSLTSGLDLLPTLSDLSAHKQALLGKIDEVKGRLRGLLEEETRLARWCQQYESNPAGLRPAVEGRLAKLQAEHAERSSETSDTWSKLRQHNEGSAAVRANLPSLTREMARLKRRQAALQVPREAVRRAIDIVVRLLDHVSELLAGGVELRARAALAAITEERYTDLALEGKHLDPVVHTRSGVVRRGESATGALGDQMFFALRVALADELASVVLLPFLVDDPFLHLDAAQLQHMQTYLKALAQRRQVILFTHDERLRSLGGVAYDFGHGAAMRDNAHLVASKP